VATEPLERYARRSSQRFGWRLSTLHVVGLNDFNIIVVKFTCMCNDQFEMQLVLSCQGLISGSSLPITADCSQTTDVSLDSVDARRNEESVDATAHLHPYKAIECHVSLPLLVTESRNTTPHASSPAEFTTIRWPQKRYSMACVHVELHIFRGRLTSATALLQSS
jgi:hypothetical protein